MTINALQKLQGAPRVLFAAGVLWAVGNGAVAQETGAPETMRPVIITGSYIPTVDANASPSPVKVLTAAEIQKIGVATVSDVLQRMPQNNSGMFNESLQGGNSFSRGSSAVSLRGLGPNATLVLLNGRRLASYGFAQNITDQFVDLNSIPLAAVERIEILKDGASALYGSDAIAGVVNIVLKREFTGTEVTARIGNVTRGDDMLEQSYSAAWGVLTEKGSALVVADWFSRNALFYRDRDFSKSADQRARGGVDLRSSSGNPGTIILTSPWTAPDGTVYGTGRYRVPTSPAVPGRPTALEIVANPGVNRFDFNPWISAYPDTTRYGAFSAIDYQVLERVKVFLEASFRRVNYEVTAAPTPVFGDLDGFVVPASNPYNPFGQDVTFRYRLTEAGPRIDEGETDAIRLLPGVKVDLGGDWTAEAAFLWSESRTLEVGKNFISAQALRDALNSTDPATALNVFGAGTGINSPDVINSLKVRTFRSGDSTLWSPDVRASGTLPIDWGAGRVGLAVGGEYRQEDVKDLSDPFSEGGNIVSSGGTSGAGSRDAWAGYIEARIPLLGQDLSFPGVKEFEVQAAGRFEQYSDFGNTANPKVGARWKPLDQVVLRGTYAESFRAPSLVELFQGKSTSFDFLSDPARGENNLQYRIERGGNPNLDPEEAKSWTAGIAVEPIKNLTLSVDWFHIKQTGKIEDLDPQDILNNEALFPGRVIRNPPTAQDIAQGIPGTIVKIISGYENIAERKVEGLDFGIRYVYPTESWGEFTLDASASWLYRFDEVPKPGDPTIHYAGAYNVPEWRGYGTLSWDYKAFTFSFTANYIGEYDQSNQIRYKYVDDLWTFDLQAGYSFKNMKYDLLNNVRLIVGVLNVTDEDPPFSDASGDVAGYDTAIHDPRGRFWYVQVSKKF
jgi:iron complex outermembrane receptor protein